MEQQLINDSNDNYNESQYSSNIQEFLSQTEEMENIEDLEDLKISNQKFQQEEYSIECESCQKIPENYIALKCEHNLCLICMLDNYLQAINQNQNKNQKQNIYLECKICQKKTELDQIAMEALENCLEKEIGRQKQMIKDQSQILIHQNKIHQKNSFQEKNNESDSFPKIQKQKEFRRVEESQQKQIDLSQTQNFQIKDLDIKTQKNGLINQNNFNNNFQNFQLNQKKYAFDKSYQQLRKNEEDLDQKNNKIQKVKQSPQSYKKLQNYLSSQKFDQEEKLNGKNKQIIQKKKLSQDSEEMQQEQNFISFNKEGFENKKYSQNKDEYNQNNLLKENLNCEEHPIEEANLFCFTCECKCLCIQCITENKKHLNHEVKSINRSSDLLQGRLLSLLSEVQDKKEIVQQFLENNQLSILNSQQKINLYKNQVEDTFQEIFKDLQDKKQIIQHKIQFFLQDRLQNYQQDNSILEENQKTLSTLFSQLKTINMQTKQKDNQETFLGFNYYAQCKQILRQVQITNQNEQNLRFLEIDQIMEEVSSFKSQIDQNLSGFLNFSYSFSPSRQRNSPSQQYQQNQKNNLSQISVSSMKNNNSGQQMKRSIQGMQQQIGQQQQINYNNLNKQIDRTLLERTQNLLNQLICLTAADSNEDFSQTEINSRIQELQDQNQLQNEEIQFNQNSDIQRGNKFQFEIQQNKNKENSLPNGQNFFTKTAQIGLYQNNFTQNLRNNTPKCNKIKFQAENNLLSNLNDNSSQSQIKQAGKYQFSQQNNSTQSKIINLSQNNSHTNGNNIQNFSIKNSVVAHSNKPSQVSINLMGLNNNSKINSQNQSSSRERSFSNLINNSTTLKGIQNSASQKLLQIFENINNFTGNGNNGRQDSLELRKSRKNLYNNGNIQLNENLTKTNSNYNQQSLSPMVTLQKQKQEYEKCKRIHNLGV